jgi:ubiquitin carboxyl-terminal hydrolase 25/28
LREAISADLVLSDDKAKFSDDDLKKHRVGGRLVTRREITRSRKCAPNGFESLDLRSY